MTLTPEQRQELLRIIDLIEHNLILVSREKNDVEALARFARDQLSLPEAPMTAVQPTKYINGSSEISSAYVAWIERALTASQGEVTQWIASDSHLRSIMEVARRALLDVAIDGNSSHRFAAARAIKEMYPGSGQVDAVIQAEPTPALTAATREQVNSIVHDIFLEWPNSISLESESCIREEVVDAIMSLLGASVTKG